MRGNSSGKRNQGRNKHSAIKTPKARFTSHQCSLLRELLASTPEEPTSKRRSSSSAEEAPTTLKRPCNDKKNGVTKSKPHIIAIKVVFQYQGEAGKQVGVVEIATQPTFEFK